MVDDEIIFSYFFALAGNYPVFIEAKTCFGKKYLRNNFLFFDILDRSLKNSFSKFRFGSVSILFVCLFCFFAKGKIVSHMLQLVGAGVRAGVEVDALPRPRARHGRRALR